MFDDRAFDIHRPFMGPLFSGKCANVLIDNEKYIFTTENHQIPDRKYILHSLHLFVCTHRAQTHKLTQRIFSFFSRSAYYPIA